MSVNNEHNNLVRLGDYIELIDKRNSDLKYGISDVCGISNNKEIMPTRANVEGTELHNFLVVEQEELIYNSRTTRMGDKIGLGFNDTGKTLITSWNNTAFRVKSESKGHLLPLYLFIYFKRSEFDRYTRYNSWGSSTEIFSWDSMCDVKIPLPPIEVQQELVDTYNGLKAMAEQNEALIKPLTEACQAYIVDCKKKYKEVELGGYIEECIEKNRDLKFESKDARGVYSNGTFGDTLANLEGSNLTSYKVVKTDEFAYSNRINIGSIAQNNEKDVIVSPSYTVFRVKSEEIIPKYLFILLRRNEFLRSTLFFAIGTIKDDFSYDRMTEVKIPLLPIEVQQTILNLYNCAEEAKKIATEAREKMKTLCPALVQKAIYS
jgi:type I restriction enzyme S subunit